MMKVRRVTSDGFLGAPLSYQRNPNDTVTDSNTGLMWELKDAVGGIHDADAKFSWSDGGGGRTVQGFIAALNKNKYGGFSDWRVPCIKELFELLDFSVIETAMSPGFPGRVPGSVYWSCTPSASEATHMWNVDFSYGNTFCFEKTMPLRVRAVRG